MYRGQRGFISTTAKHTQNDIVVLCEHFICENMLRCHLSNNIPWVLRFDLNLIGSNKMAWRLTILDICIIPEKKFRLSPIQEIMYLYV